MINRIVRMSFDPNKVEEFLALFESVKGKIANFEGCEGLTLLRDSAQPNVLFTYSYWQTESHLNKYRFSDLFKTTWTGTKALFNDAPMAWSLVVEQQVK
ncbi:MAG: antibiotic biosynthesis monooxygenase [Bacteroidia bacterium]|nr:antibiotic biosynthesis monooxygenase [Bacteroidia bacterium]MCF8428313.1 antibiotic biosynthesis monooxygenase [Bacteroidia bacterium]MCF8447841.1 antibiotic biosynthesis monooxygenase [Bacteroidia bacterium]